MVQSHVLDEDVDLAVAAAKTAFKNWKNTPAEKRGECLDRLADKVHENLDLLVKAESRDNGKPVGLAGHGYSEVREEPEILCFCYKALRIEVALYGGCSFELYTEKATAW